MQQESIAVDFTQTADLIRQAQRVVVICHVIPDADAIGSAAAVALALPQLGKTVLPSFGENLPVPETLRTIPGAELFVSMADVPDDADLVMTVDCASLQRTGELAPVVRAAHRVLVIDHHVVNQSFGTHHLIDSSANSTTTLLLSLFDELGIVLDRDIAQALYSGLMMDTGSFRWGSPNSHEMASRLLSYGFSASLVARQLLDSHTLPWLGVLARVLGNADIFPGDNGVPDIIVGTVCFDDIQAVRREDVESIVEIIQTVEGIGITIVLKEYEIDGWKVSLRSDPGFEIASIARRFGGGGHRHAGGFSFSGSRDELLAILREDIIRTFSYRSL